jgi:hypothetical protein
MKQGRAMAQAVIRLPLTADTRLRARVRPYGICGGQSGTGASLYTSYLVLPCQYHSIVALHWLIDWLISMGWDYVSEMLPLTDY